MKIDFSRLTSPVLISGWIAQIVAIFLLAGVIDVGQSEMITKIVALACEVWVAVSQYNNPTDRAKF